eukprot:TRINITY_DN4424_c0_g1_i1.p1 TRINITY_DN4424_c0_g1~~TRINITY_DN4424_c0_g1_i1.p1  ORF type:complete len:811 (-),score=412.86 TRINITY_DN4424_c0_g1_i1:78-2510(-)
MSAKKTRVVLDDDDFADPIPIPTNEVKMEIFEKDTAALTSQPKVAVKKEATVKKEAPKKEAPKKEIPKTKSKSKAESESDFESSSESESETESEDDFEFSQKSPPKKASAKTAVKKETPAKKETPKKTPAKKEAPKKAPAKAVKKESETSEPKKKKAKVEEEEEYKWWNEDSKVPDGKKWVTLEHKGPLFPPAYDPLPPRVKFYYDGKPIALTPSEEEVAVFYARYLETEHVTKSAFRTNFFQGFLSVLNEGRSKKDQHPIKEFDKCDFTKIHKYLQEQKEIRKSMSKAEKDKEKEEKQRIQEIYGFAMVDGHKQKVGNFMIEPPGLFLGRGSHPKTGTLKRRVLPSDVIINIGKKVKVPESPIPGTKWKEVTHDDTVTWLANWKESVNDGHKYIWLASTSRIKGVADLQKFEKARELHTHIDSIRKKCAAELKDKDRKVSQRSTALWLIDKLALRVGNEKSEDQADTVGCCSLRVEHVTLSSPNTLTLDFLGKDSMRYTNTVEVDPQVFKNLNDYVKGKKPQDDLFESLTTTQLNSHLTTMMDGLTAKVFRTYNASITLQKELENTPKDLTLVEEKVLFYNRANLKVAILCNHQRSLPKAHNEQMGKIDLEIKQLEEHRGVLEKHIVDLKKGKVREYTAVLSTIIPKKKKATVASQEEPKTDSKKRKREEEEEEEEGEQKLVKLPSDVEKTKSQITKLNERIRKHEIKKTEKDDLKTVALGTSKINYLDPRITAAWCKANDVPIDRIFAKTLREKFPWALDVNEDYDFRLEGTKKAGAKKTVKKEDSAKKPASLTPTKKIVKKETPSKK